MKTVKQFERKLTNALEFFAEDYVDNLYEKYGESRVAFKQGETDALEYALGYTLVGTGDPNVDLRIYPRNTFEHPYRCMTCNVDIPDFHGILRHEEKNIAHKDFKCLIGTKKFVKTLPSKAMPRTIPSKKVRHNVLRKYIEK